MPEHYANKYRGCGGGASAAGIKIQYSYNLLGEEDSVLEISDATATDAASSVYKILPKELRVEDLGYFNLLKFEKIHEAEGYFLSRFKFGVVVHKLEHGIFKKIYLTKIISKMRVGEIKDLEVHLGLKNKLPTRLILEKVPPEVSTAKRRKLKTDKQNKRKIISKERLNFCDVNAYITNADKGSLPLELIKEIYGLRWQIELVFKSWKTIFNVDKVKKVKIERFECFFYGCLILILLFTKLSTLMKQYMWKIGKLELSEWKGMMYLRDNSNKFNQALLGTENQLEKVIRGIWKWLTTRCLKEVKKNKITPKKSMNKLFLN